MAAEPSQEYAERPKEGELWQQMIERQRREGNTQDGSSPERLRSLPQEQQRDLERGGRGDISPFGQPPLVTEEPMAIYQQLLQQAQNRSSPDRSVEIER